MVAGEFGQLYVSMDFGVTWTYSKPAGETPWKSLASSSDGSKVVGVNFSGSSFDLDIGIYTSPALGFTGYLVGGQLTAIELQYIGNNKFLTLSQEGFITGIPSF